MGKPKIVHLEGHRMTAQQAQARLTEGYDRAMRSAADAPARLRGQVQDSLMDEYTAALRQIEA